MSRFLNHWVAVILFTALAVALRVLDPSPIAQLRLFAFDSYQRLAPRAYSPQLPVRIVNIDDASLDAYGQWPWPRTRLADLVERLYALGAATVGIDVIFSEPDRSSPEQILANLPDDPAFQSFAQTIAGRATHDEMFGKSIERGPTVLGVILNQSGTGASHRPAASFAFSGDNPRAFVPAFSGVAGNVAPLEQVASGLGALNWVPDADQIVRRIPVISQIGDDLFPAFSTELLRVAQGASTYVIKSSGASGEQAFGQSTGVIAAKVGEFEVPTTSSGEMWIRYSGTQKARYVSVVDVMEGRVDPGEIEGRIILVGTSAAGLFDIRASPLDVALPGVEVHAEAIEQILTGSFLIRPDFALAMELAFLLALGLMMAVSIARIGPQWTGLVALASVAGALGFSWLAFHRYGWLLDPVYPTIMGVMVYVLGTLAGYLRTEIERDRVRDAFGHYLAPALVEQLAVNPQRLRLGGDLRDVTVLFLDIRGFTGISERLNATQLTGFINRFLTPMTDTILAHNGTIDKYMGDAVMAFWNAPLDDPDHARNACDAALALIRRLEEFNDVLAAERDGGELDVPLPVRIGVGLNTGPCCVGNLGSEQRFAYSAIGDDVNVASRLEGQSKAYGLPIILGDATAASVGDYAHIEIDLLRVKGKSRPVGVYTLLGGPEMAARASFQEFSKRHADMLSAFRGRQWKKAARLVEECAALDEEDRLSGVHALYRWRLEQFSRKPPPREWDGVADAVDK